MISPLVKKQNAITHTFDNATMTRIEQLEKAVRKHKSTDYDDDDRDNTYTPLEDTTNKPIKRPRKRQKVEQSDKQKENISEDILTIPTFNKKIESKIPITTVPTTNSTATSFAAMTVTPPSRNTSLDEETDPEMAEFTQQYLGQINEVLQREVLAILNSKDAIELASLLKGIGQKRAQQIMEYRQNGGKFITLSDLKEVGFGEKTVNNFVLNQVHLLCPTKKT